MPVKFSEPGRNRKARQDAKQAMLESRMVAAREAAVKPTAATVAWQQTPTAQALRAERLARAAKRAERDRDVRLLRDEVTLRCTAHNEARAMGFREVKPS